MGSALKSTKGLTMKSVTDYKHSHKGQPCLVCGTGDSIKELTPEIRDKFVLISVNAFESVTSFSPDYLVILDRLDYSIKHNPQWIIDKLDAIYRTKCESVFTVRDVFLTDVEGVFKGFACRNVIKIKTAKMKGAWESVFDSGVLPQSYTSAITACGLAMFMGFAQIGFLGVDMKGHPQLEQHAKTIDQSFEKLLTFARSKGIELVNLSKDSLIELVPKYSLNEFIRNYAGDKNV